MTPSEWFWGGFYLGFGVLVSTALVMGAFSIFMVVIEHVGNKRSEKKFKEEQEKRYQEEFEASYRRYLREHPEVAEKTNEEGW